MTTQSNYNLIPAPRSVPLLIRMEVLFGGVMNQMGWFFLGFGLIFVWVFGGNADFNSLLHFQGKSETRKGIIIESKKTNFSENDKKVYANYYSFQTQNGIEYKGVSYSRNKRLSKNDIVNIEYPNGKPNISRIKGMRTAPFSFYVALIVCIFPLIGFGLMIGGLKNGIKANNLLANGTLEFGRLISKDMTNTRINNIPVYKFTFEFIADDGGTYEAIAKTHLTRNLEDENKEPLLYDQYNPSYAIMLDSLPGSPGIDDMGNFQTKNYITAILSLIIPALTIFGHGTFIFLIFFA